MFMARVIGTVTASRKEPTLDGVKFLVLERIDEALESKHDFVVAVDAVSP